MLDGDKFFWEKKKIKPERRRGSERGRFILNLVFEKGLRE